MELGYFDIARRDYERIELVEQLELLSLLADIALHEGKPGGITTKRPDCLSYGLKHPGKGTLSLSVQKARNMFGPKHYSKGAPHAGSG